MTTTVIVKANHGWSVDVTTMVPGGMPNAAPHRVAPGTEYSFSVHSTADLLIHEVQPDEGEAKPAADRMLQFFAYAHLPPHLQAISRPFGMLAEHIVKTLPSNPERTAGLRKLLEAKDCAVRANLYKD